MASQGANLIVHGVAPPSELDALAAKLAKAHGVKCFASDADLLGGESSIGRMCTAAEGAPVDILVNNAGIQVRLPPPLLPPDAARPHQRERST